MKSAFKINEPQSTFKPVTLTFVCETEEELINIWLRFNLHRSQVIGNGNNASTTFSPEQIQRAMASSIEGNTEAWNTVNDATLEAGIPRKIL